MYVFLLYTLYTELSRKGEILLGSLLETVFGRVGHRDSPASYTLSMLKMSYSLQHFVPVEISEEIRG